MATITHASEKVLEVVANHKLAALNMAYEMLCEIQSGNCFDAADYIRRKAAIAAAIDIFPVTQAVL